MSQNLILPNNLPQVQLSPELVARAQKMLADAASNLASAPPRLSFGGKMFNLTKGGTTVELPDRVLDVHIVAVDTRHHYVFYEKPYEGVDGDPGRIMARYPTEQDTFEFTPTKEFAQRAYKHRAVVMLANDQSHDLYIVDFGYNSCRRVGDSKLGLFSLSQLVTMLNHYSQQNAALLPFLFTVQLSFTRETIPEVQFSLFDQRNQGSRDIRFADVAAINAMQEAFTSGRVDELMKVEFDSGDKQNHATAAPKAPPAPTAQQPAPQVQQPAPQVQGVQDGAFSGLTAL